MAVTALVLGILAVVAAYSLYFLVPGIALAALAAILGTLAFRRRNRRPIAIAAIGCGIASAVISLHYLNVLGIV